MALVGISANSSPVLETASKGIHVILVGRQTVLNQNLLDNLNMEVVTEYFSADDLVIAINKYLLSTQIKKYKEMGKRIRDLFFTPVPVNEEIMEPFLLSKSQ